MSKVYKIQVAIFLYSQLFFSLATNIGPQALPFSGITKRLHFWPVGAKVKSWEQVLAMALISTGTMVLLEVRSSLITSWFSALDSVHVEYTSSPPGRKAFIADLKSSSCRTGRLFLWWILQAAFSESDENSQLRSFEHGASTSTLSNASGWASPISRPSNSDTLIAFVKVGGMKDSNVCLSHLTLRLSYSLQRR